MESSRFSGCAVTFVTSLFTSVIYGSAYWSAATFLTSLAPRGFDWGMGAFFGMAAMSLAAGVIFFVGSLVFGLTLRSSRPQPSMGGPVFSAYILSALLALVLLYAWTGAAEHREAALAWALLLSAGLGLIGPLQIAFVYPYRDTETDRS